jgi:alkanesulfonate monooxygenase SsuD/methylene tetrahydromethanopterin reductase-like flavin-dependent oxidoreductase (luciferase family)
VFGTGLDRYEHGFAEGLDLLLAGLSGPTVAGTGERFRFREVAVVPEARTRPHPPVVLACTSPATVDLAAARGLPMLLGLQCGDPDRVALLARYAASASAAGREPGQIGHIATVLAQVADSRADAVALLRAAMPGWLAAGLAGYRPVDGRARPRRDPHEYTDLLCDLHPVGSPADCVRRLRASAATTGIRHVLMLVEGCGDPGRTMANIARLGAEVLPLLRD